MDSKTVAVFGATGQIGYPLARYVLKNGHRVVAISRSRTSRNADRLAQLEKQGARLVFCPDLHQVDKVAALLEGCDTLVASVRAGKQFLEETQPRLLTAAARAGVQRFVPNEFGVHTQAVALGSGDIFDRKKKFQELLFASSLQWTLFYNGGIFDYFLPNLRFFDQITTFGNLELPIYTHHIEDIGQIAARAVVDDRTANKCVQMDYNALTQNQMLDLLKTYWPDYPFVYQHYSTEYITEMKETADNRITAKKGSETDKERWGINYVVYVLGQLAAFNDVTLRATDLYPAHVCITPAQVLKNPAFVFEAKNSARD
jgi:uncharacterized protein YbjT (DUF2867 family)